MRRRRADPLSAAVPGGGRGSRPSPWCDYEGSRASGGAAEARWPDDLGDITLHRAPSGRRGRRDRVDGSAGWGGRSATDSSTADGSRSPASHHVGAASKSSRRPLQHAKAEKQFGLKGDHFSRRSKQAPSGPASTRRRAGRPPASSRAGLPSCTLPTGGIERPPRSRPTRRLSIGSLDFRRAFGGAPPRHPWTRT
jgi:hypothetical protein